MPRNLTIITDIHADAPEKVLVQAKLDKKVYNYFFRHTLAGSHGPRQAFINFFYQRFYEACVLNGIAEAYDEDNERRMWEILQQLNFRKP